jgi:hypothetical protein
MPSPDHDDVAQSTAAPGVRKISRQIKTSYNGSHLPRPPGTSNSNNRPNRPRHTGTAGERTTAAAGTPKKEAPVGGTGAAGRRRLGCRVRGLLPHANLCSISAMAPSYVSTRFPIIPIAAVAYRRHDEGLRISCVSDRSACVALPPDCSLPRALGNFVCPDQFICAHQFPRREQ